MDVPPIYRFFYLAAEAAAFADSRGVVPSRLTAVSGGAGVAERMVS